METRFPEDLLRFISQGEEFTVVDLMKLPGSSFAEYAEDSKVVAAWLRVEADKNGRGLVRCLHRSYCGMVYLLAPTALDIQKDRKQRVRASNLYTAQMHPENRLLAIYREVGGEDFSYSNLPTLGGYDHRQTLKNFLRAHLHKKWYVIDGEHGCKTLKWTTVGRKKFGKAKTWLKSCRYSLLELRERLYALSRGEKFLPTDFAEALGVKYSSLRQRLEVLADDGYLEMGDKESSGPGTPRTKQHYRLWTQKAHAELRHLLAEGEGK